MTTAILPLPLPGTDVAVSHIRRYDDGNPSSAAFTMHDNYVVVVSGHPLVDCLADGAQPLQGWGKVVRPTKVQHLGAVFRQVRLLLGDVDHLEQNKYNMKKVIADLHT